MINQPLLPQFLKYNIGSSYRVAQAISTMIVRGAGAIGATGLMDSLAAFEAPSDAFLDYIQKPKTPYRYGPTAQIILWNNLYIVPSILSQTQDLNEVRLQRRSRTTCRLKIPVLASTIFGEALIPNKGRISTHCNAGWLAFVD